MIYLQLKQSMNFLKWIIVRFIWMLLLKYYSNYGQC